MERMKLLQGDCLELMKNIEDQSVNMILCDLPYGTTACKWDTVIPFEPLWEQYERIIKENGAIVLFGQEPFSTHLRMSNLKLYKYDWIWDKKIPSGMSYARYQPMRQHEIISVFYKSNCYYPQKTKRDKPIKSGGMRKIDTLFNDNWVALKKNYTHKNPTSILKCDKIRKGSIHPTQKPVALLEYLIKTYTQENETVLDNCMGSGSTGIACLNANRKFIGMELDETYFGISEKRIEEHTQQLKLF